MSSRSVLDLHPDVRELYHRFSDESARQHLDYLLTCTWRSKAEQEELYAIGRTKPGRIVTRAHGGQSAHNYMLHGIPNSLAFDICPMRFGKLLVWGTSGNGIDEDPSDDDKDDLELWQRIGQVGVSVGLQWYGSPTAPFREFPHFQDHRSPELLRAMK